MKIIQSVLSVIPSKDIHSSFGDDSHMTESAAGAGTLGVDDVSPFTLIDVEFEEITASVAAAAAEEKH